MQNLILSNRVEILAEVLKKQLFEDSSEVLQEQWIIVPSQAMKRWLMMNMADDPSLHIAMGLKFPYLDKAVQTLSSRIFPSRRELGFLIEQVIEKFLQDDQFPDLLLILKQLHITKETLHQNGARKKLATFSEEIARLFLDYGRFAENMIQEWLQRPSLEWQAVLYRAIFPLPALPRQKAPRIHIFCPSFIPRSFLPFFDQATLYTLSSTVHFIERAEESWLSRLSLVEKQFLSFFEQEPVKAFQLPHEIAEQDPYKSFITQDVLLVDEPLSLLKLVQAEWLLQPEGGLRPPMNDRSIELHACPSKLREVEVLYQNLNALMSEHSLTPKEVVIMAPAMSDYAPFIEAVFGAADSALPVQFFDVRQVSTSPLVQGFLDLIALSESRLEKECFAKLLYNPLFQKKLGWSQSDSEKVLQWMESVQWGVSAEDRLQWIKNLYGKDDYFEILEEGSWNFCFDTYFKDVLSLDLDKEPLVLKELALFDQWYCLYDSLKADIFPLRQGENQRSLGEWISFLNALVQKYFGSDLDGLESLGKLPSGLFSFSSIRPRLEDIFTGERETFGSQNLIDAITCCSLLPMRAVPSEIICLLGMGLECFPRKNLKSSLDKREGRTDVDFSPSPSDFDRMLFLETVLSTRKCLLLSYTKGREEKAPSLLVVELLEFIQKTFGISLEEKVHTEKIQVRSLREQKSLKWEKIEYPPFEEVSLQELSSCIRNPLKLFFNKRLNCHFKEKPEKTLLLSSYEKKIVERRALQEDADAILEDLIIKGRIPPKPLGSVVEKQIRAICHDVEEGLKKHTLHKDALYSIELVKGLNEPFREGKTEFLPALQVPYKGRLVTITGKIHSACEKGLISLKDKTVAGMCPEWPLAQACKGAVLLLSGEKISLPQVPWEHFLEYYERCLNHLVSFFPEHVEGKEPASNAYLKFYEIMEEKEEPLSIDFFDPLKEALKCL